LRRARRPLRHRSPRRGSCPTALLLASVLALLAAACGNGPAQGARPALSDAVKLNQVGYLPARPKLAIVTATQAAGAFVVRRSAGDTEALRGTLGPQVSDPDTGDTVRIADFSVLREAGSYYLDVAGVGASHEFDVSPTVYSRLFYLAMRAFYGQRCGTAVDLAPTFSGYSHPACHVAGAANPDALMHTSSGARGDVDGSQGWHDAGDYGKYVVNSGITTGELIWTYESFAGRVGAVRLDIPESGNPVPDILDEIRWNLDWMLRMQDRDGGVWPKLTSERFGGFVMPHVDNGGPRYVIGTGTAPFKSSCATGDFAAVMAAASRVFRPFDVDFSRLTLAAAERAWRWLSQHPNVVFRNCCGVQTGEYGDDNCADERLWAAAELLALVTYYFSGQPDADEGVRAQIRADTVAAAEAIVARTAANPYRVSLRSTDYNWGSNGAAANYGVLLALAHAMQPRAAYLDTAADNLHYLLGRNSFGLSWVTQVGDRPFRNPHHRPSGADTNAEPWPGLLSGGPNRYGGDPVIDAVPAMPPARRYRDDQASYASNEIAINWNAPLVFLVASLLPESGR